MNKRPMILMVLLLIASLLISACSGNSTESGGGSGDGESLEGETVSVLLSAGGVGQFNAWKARSEAFTEETGIEVEFIEVPYENLLESITTDGISQTGTYDLVAHLDVMGSSIQQFLEPLNEYASEDDFDFSRWPEAYLELSTFNEEIYSLPVRAHVQMMFYREDVFNQLGLEPPQTWEDVATASDAIRKNTDLYGIAPYYAAGNNGQNLYMWTAYLWSNGGQLFDENMKPTFNNEAGLEATKRYIDLLLEKQAAPPESVTFGEQDARTYFKQGKAAMWLGWWWVYSDFNSGDSSAEEVLGNVGFTSVPEWKGKESQANVSTFPVGMMKSSQNKEAAWEVMKWLSNPELELEIVKDTLQEESPPDQHSPVITQKENLRNEELNELSDDFYNTAADSLENARALPSIKEWPQIADILSTAISDMATGQPVEENLDEAAQRVEELLRQSGYYE